jgi:hypothetical protein
MDEGHSTNPEMVLLWEACCGALAELSSDSRTYATAKYQHSDDERIESANRVYSNLFYSFTDDHAQSKKIDLKIHHLKMLCMIAVKDDLWSNRCGVCKGIKSRVIGHQVVVCQRCGGTGRFSYTDNVIARMLGMSRSAFCKRYKRKYLEIKKVLTYWDLEVHNVCSKIRI